MYWNKTITLYNKYEDEQGDTKYIRHKLERCFCKMTDTTKNNGDVQAKTSGFIIRIPEQGNYLPPYKWLALSADEKENFITLQSGDLIFLDDIDDEINENISGQRSSDLITKYKALGSLFINSVNINTDLPGAHYYVRGE